jgi:hypothetical protein
VGNILKLPTIYVMKYLNMQVLNGLSTGLLTTTNHDNSALYDAAAAELGADALVNSHVVATDRDFEGAVSVVVSTPHGQRLIRARKLVVAIPPKLHNLAGLDLDETERHLFGKFKNTSYWTALLNNTGIPDGLQILNQGSDTLYNLPVLPRSYLFQPTTLPGIFNAFFGSATRLSDAEVKQQIVDEVLRLRNDGLPTTTPDFVAFERHSPFELRVDAEEIRDGFYKRLNGLQGHSKTWWTGATWQAHDSSQIWSFTEGLLRAIAA